ncbi:TetR/AcrR family transcriptional regulator [Aquitalea denitrificans]|uniref:TetR/AcrR family transcriptional regulator n=1 Tax=Aquitalea denitrificans TaxID=519081 RepID=UPI00135CE8DD|nr:TetR/AcrR family transcriptional regulator [Aquitalea denitrificans]
MEAENSRRERKRQQTMEHLVECAFELFSQYGYEAVTMEQIAQRADLAKGTLYKYFPVKEALVTHRMHADLAAVLPRMQQQLADAPDCSTRLRLFLRASASYSEERREYIGPYIQHRLCRPISSMGTDNRSGLDRIYLQLLAAGQQSGEIRADIPASHLARHLAFLHMGAMMYWFKTPETSLHQGYDEILDIFLQGART